MHTFLILNFLFFFFAVDRNNGRHLRPCCQHIRSIRLLKFSEWWMSLEEPERSGYLAVVESSSRLETLTVLIIMLNAAFMGYSADYDINHTSEGPSAAMLGIERFFASCFWLELVLRLLAHGRWFFFNANMKWNLQNFQKSESGRATHEDMVNGRQNDATDEGTQSFQRPKQNDEMYCGIAFGAFLVLRDARLYSVHSCAFLHARLHDTTEFR